MSQYKQTPGQQKHLKRMYAEKAEAEKDATNWDTPHDEPMTLAEAREAVKREHEQWISRGDNA